MKKLWLLPLTFSLTILLISSCSRPASPAEIKSSAGKTAASDSSNTELNSDTNSAKFATSPTNRPEGSTKSTAVSEPDKGASNNTKNNFSTSDYTGANTETSDKLAEDTHATITVEEGDTWWSISAKTGIYYEYLAAFNGKDPEEVIYPGETYKIPSADDIKKLYPQSQVQTTSNGTIANNSTEEQN